MKGIRGLELVGDVMGKQHIPGSKVHKKTKTRHHRLRMEEQDREMLKWFQSPAQLALGHGEPESSISIFF